MATGWRASVVLSDLADALALAPSPLVAVTVPGPASVRISGARHTTALRSDRHRDGAFADRCGIENRGAIVATDLQWADDRSVQVLLDLAAGLVDRAAPTGSLIAAWRHGSDRPLLAELLLLAGSNGSVIEVVPDTIASLIERGVEPDRAAELVAATGGLPDLIEALEAGHSLAADMTARLTLLEDSARAAAEELAFGAGAIAEFDRRSLVVEGLVPQSSDAPMPQGVAAAIRSTCPPARRAVVIGRLAERVDGVELAAHLLALGDRSPEAARCYMQAARSSGAGAQTADLARAARQAGADDATCRRLAADGLLATGRPAEALRELGALGDPLDERGRALAWWALGDAAAAAAAFHRAGEAAWAAHAEVAAGLDGANDPTVTDDGDAASLIARAALRWRTGRFERPDDVLTDLATAARRQAATGAVDAPLLAGEVLVRLAERLGEHAAAARAAATTADQAGPPHAVAARLLSGWIDARRGLLDSAVAASAVIEPLGPRVQLIREAARCAVAVRDTEGAELDVAAAAGLAAASAVAPSLLDVDLLTDVAAAVERGRVEQASCPLDQVGALVEGGGAHLRFDLAWCRLQASLAGDRPPEIAERARELVALDPIYDRHARATDIRALARAVVAPSEARSADVVAVARRLATAGAPHVAARLCGIIATATSDDATARMLLRESRAWRASRTRVRRSAGNDVAIVLLTAHEEQVARLVIEGRTHKEIGAALFVSPKTVEHHVAHIRTKLGVTTRAAMLAALHDYLG